MRKPVVPLVLDTDIGDDVDDALALALALNSSELDLCGITTVYGNAPRRALLAQHLLKIWKREKVPVAAGCSKPLLQPLQAQSGAQFEILENDVLEKPLPHAVDFLIQAARIEDDPDPENLLTIAPIGALTNVALAIAKEPELVSRCRIVMMGGMWNARDKDFKAEWNVSCDPEAAAIVFESGIEINMIGLDVTTQCALSEDHVTAIAKHNTPRARVLSQLIEIWMRESKRPPTLHDPLALMTLFSDCVEFEEKKIEIELCGKERGRMRVQEGQPNARVAVAVDDKRAIELFMERVLA